MPNAIETRKRQLEYLISVTRQSLTAFEGELHNIVNISQARRPMSDREKGILEYRTRIMNQKHKKNGTK